MRPSRHLWPQVCRIIRECQPAVVFCENVEGHLSLGFPSVGRSLQRLGYRVRAGLFLAAEAGAAHIRRRLFILAHANGEDERQHGRLAHGRKWAAISGQPEHQRQPDWLEPGHPVVDAVLGDEQGAGLCTQPAVERVFAPAPCDFEAWQQVLGRQSNLQPGFYGLADGVANRLERSALAGNGVCPLAAAIAFRTLSKGFLRWV